MAIKKYFPLNALVLIAVCLISCYDGESRRAALNAPANVTAE
jgi:hypothetical protein